MLLLFLTFMYIVHCILIAEFGLKILKFVFRLVNIIIFLAYYQNLRFPEEFIVYALN